MSWLMKVKNEVPKPLGHSDGKGCDLPYWDEAETGSIWVCDECLRIWVVVEYESLSKDAKANWSFRMIADQRIFACDK